MNRITILLETKPTYERCEVIAHMMSAEHFGRDAESWEITNELPLDTPLHLRDQFEAEIKGRKLSEVLFLVVTGPESTK